MADAKPQCGGGQEQGVYDVGLHVAGLFLVMTASILGCGFPVVARKVKWLKVPEKVFFGCKHFGTGVLIATAFVHLIPTAFQSLSDPCLPSLWTDDYPAMPGFIMMIALFTLFIIEMWMNGKMGGQAHSHGGPKGFEQPSPAAAAMMVNNAAPAQQQPDEVSFEAEDEAYEKEMARKLHEESVRYQQQHGYDYDDPNNAAAVNSQMPPWFAVFYEQYVRQRMEMVNMIRRQSSTTLVSSSSASSSSSSSSSSSGGHQAREASSDGEKQQDVIVTQKPMFDAEGQPVDPMVYKKMSMNITLLEGGILFHSVFVGITISITIQGFIVLLIAMLFHQSFEGLGLGSRIAAVPYSKGSPKPWLLVFAFGLTAPLGQAIGLGTRGSYDPNSAFGLIIVGVFNAISSGLLLYAATVDLLAEDFLSAHANEEMTSKDKKWAFFFVLMGAAGMSVVGAFA